jgi:hypothetical protein
LNQRPCCGSESAWICIQFALWIRIQLWNAVPDLAALTIAPKAEIYLDQRSSKRKYLISKYVFSTSSLSAYNNMQMVKVFSTKKHKYSLGTKGNHFYLIKDIGKIPYIGI